MIGKYGHLIALAAFCLCAHLAPPSAYAGEGVGEMDIFWGWHMSQPQHFRGYWDDDEPGSPASTTGYNWADSDAFEGTPYWSSRGDSYRGNESMQTPQMHHFGVHAEGTEGAGDDGDNAKTT